jgi:hypothetical protein
MSEREFPPMAGPWVLIRPDGKTYRTDSPLRCVSMESRERIPATVALQRIYDAADEPTELEKEMVNALQLFTDTIHAVENRCMAADGPVTPTCKEITDEELRKCYQAAVAALGAFRRDTSETAK